MTPRRIANWLCRSLDRFLTETQRIKAAFHSVAEAGLPRKTRGMENNELKRLFGLRVQSLRRRTGMSQQQLADAIGKSLDTVSNVERGISSTRIETMDKMANVLGVSLAELFELDAPVSRDKETRKAVERLVRLVEGEGAEAIEVLTKMVELALSLPPR